MNADMSLHIKNGYYYCFHGIYSKTFARNLVGIVSQLYSKPDKTASPGLHCIKRGINQLLWHCKGFDISIRIDR